MGTERTADSVFRLLSDETRLDILRAVAIAQREEMKTGVARLSFSEIYDRVDVDDTSKFSYHLGELTGTFLEKHEDGYAFTHAGEQLVRFVLAENYRSPSDVGIIETTGSCLHCGGEALEAQFRDQYFSMRCSDCDSPTFSYRIKPAQVRSTPEEDLIESITRELVGDFLKMRHGVCPDCAGRIDTDILNTEDESVSDDVPVSFGTINVCQQCMRFLGAPLTHVTAYHPASIAFHWDHGVDVVGTGLWELHRYLHDGRWTSERVDAGPGTYRVEMRHDSETLRLYLDENATVTRTERVERTDLRERDPR